MFNLQRIFQEGTEAHKKATLISTLEDSDRQNYEAAKMIFALEEGREPNMVNTEDMRMVSAIESGIKYSRKFFGVK